MSGLNFGVDAAPKIFQIQCRGGLELILGVPCISFLGWLEYVFQVLFDLASGLASSACVGPETCLELGLDRFFYSWNGSITYCGSDGWIRDARRKTERRCRIHSLGKVLFNIVIIKI